MSAADIPAGVQVTYRQQYRRCGKAGCSRCAAGRPGHGPYWYASWWEGGRRRSRYLGKQRPEVAGAIAGEARAVAPGTAPERAVEPLRVRTLGGFAVWRGATPIPAGAWRGRRAAALFTGLLSAPGHRLLREQAIELLWPEAEPQAGAANLRTTVHVLRRLLDGPGNLVSYVRAEGDILALVPAGDGTPPEDWLDATAFAHTAQAALAGQDPVACREALALYGGDYLPEEPYADWVAAPREALRRQHLELLLHLAGLVAARGELEEAEGCLRRALAAEPSHEGAAATLMGLLAGSGRRDEALRVYQALATALERELEVSPGAEVAALRGRLLAQEAAPRAAALPRRDLPARPTNLPIELTSFVGRGWELEEVRAALEGVRLLTLTGPGGCGKTRLALAVADPLVGAYPDGVWLVELAALADPALVPQALRLALGLREEPGTALLESLLDFLRPRALLLVLDNCEHLVGACAELASSLLRGCAHVRILATSREALGVAGERTYLVPSLSTPDPAHPPDPERLGGYEAVALFLERARARRPGQAPTGANAAAVAQICARLDGLPLAIELAAARVAALPIESIAARLDDRFQLLTGGPRTALPRQQTLRATLDWSYALLDEPERVVLRRLAVFAGGWALGAAEAVCSGGGVETWAVLDLLGGLVNKSLVLLEEANKESGDGRYRLLETVRQYGLERLRGSDEAATVRDRHLDWCLALGEQAERGLWGSEEGIWLDRLEAEHDNLRAALRWSLDEGNRPAVGVQLAVLALRFWNTRGYLSEGRMWLERALTWEGSLPPALRARALSAAGVMAWGQSDLERARILLGQSLGLRRALGDKEGLAGSLYNLGLVADDLGDRVAAKDLWRESLTLSRESGDTRGIAAALGSLATAASMDGDFEQAMQLHRESLALLRDLGNELAVAYSLGSLGNMASAQGDYEQAGALYRECLAMLRRLGDRAGMASALGSLGNTAYARDEYQQAGLLYEESLALRRAVGDQLGIATSLGTLGDVALAQGEHDRAAALLAESLALLQRLDIRPAVASPLAGMARLALVRGHAQAAARVLGAVDALRTEFTIRLDPQGLASHDRLVTAAREALGLSAFDEAWLAGRAMPLEQAIALALEVNPGTRTEAGG